VCIHPFLHGVELFCQTHNILCSRGGYHCYRRTSRGGNPYFVYRVEQWESFVYVKIPDTRCPKYCSHWIVRRSASSLLFPQSKNNQILIRSTPSFLSGPFKRRDQPS
jgi:hypothetical protein